MKSTLIICFAACTALAFVMPAAAGTSAQPADGIDGGVAGQVMADAPPIPTTPRPNPRPIPKPSKPKPKPSKPKPAPEPDK